MPFHNHMSHLQKKALSTWLQNKLGASCHLAPALRLGQWAGPVSRSIGSEGVCLFNLTIKISGNTGVDNRGALGSSPWSRACPCILHSHKIHKQIWDLGPDFSNLEVVQLCLYMGEECTSGGGCGTLL